VGFNNIIFEKKNAIAKITLNRPDVLNGIDQDTHLELQEALADIEKDDSVRVVIITGAGKTFCTGADLKFGASIREDPKKAMEFLGFWKKTNNSIASLSKPVIAAVNGLALAGGLEVVEACDIAIASEDARLGDQHANYGLLPGGGGSQRLPRLIGKRKAMELLLTGDWVSAKEAERIGLVNKAVPADKLEETVNELAEKLAERSPLQTRNIKKLVNQGMEMDLDAALDLEINTVAPLFQSEDLIEGFTAFIEKRKPVFKGK